MSLKPKHFFREPNRLIHNGHMYGTNVTQSLYAAVKEMPEDVAPYQILGQKWLYDTLNMFWGSKVRLVPIALLWTTFKCSLEKKSNFCHNWTVRNSKLCFYFGLLCYAHTFQGLFQLLVVTVQFWENACHVTSSFLMAIFFFCVECSSKEKERGGSTRCLSLTSQTFLGRGEKIPPPTKCWLVKLAMSRKKILRLHTANGSFPAPSRLNVVTYDCD